MSRRRQRLPLDAYLTEGSTWHVTTRADCVHGPLFTNHSLGQLMLETFESGCRSYGAVPHLVCVMPDHVHLLVEVRTLGLVELVGRLKSYSTMLWRKQGNHGHLWQKSFYDHGIRGPRDFEATVEYILNNPIEAGLAEEWGIYPLIGGEIHARIFDPGIE